MAHDSLETVRAALRPHLPRLTERSTAKYYGDLVTTAALGWAALVVGAGELGSPTRALASVIAVLALYRASGLMHEVTHVRGAMPRYALLWDVLVGVPLLFPSLLYVGVHTTHHARSVFGTADDPEYVPHGDQGALAPLLLLTQYALAPVLLAVRWLVLAPLTLVPPLRTTIVERFSSFAANPAYRRPLPERSETRRWVLTELACWAWSSSIAAMLLTGVISVRAIAFVAVVASAVSTLHGLRSFAAHRFHGHGEGRTLEEQLLDSVNVTGDRFLTELWAPVGLRYHALHHLMPRLPYHSLGAAHRILLDALPADHVYRRVTFDGLWSVLNDPDRAG